MTSNFRSISMTSGRLGAGRSREGISEVRGGGKAKSEKMGGDDNGDLAWLGTWEVKCGREGDERRGDRRMEG